MLIGDDPISTNSKLNNMVKGWREARHERIAFIDSNVLVPADFVHRLVASWRDDTGCVAAPPVGTSPAGFGGHLECAFLNIYEARWQYVVDTVGSGFAQGKTLVYRKADLDRTGMRELASEPAEDAATTKMVRAMGLRVRLAPPSPQPLGARKVAEVWSRQLRWARLRRATFPIEFLPEIFSGTLIPALTVAAAAASLGWPVSDDDARLSRALVRGRDRHGRRLPLAGRLADSAGPRRARRVDAGDSGSAPSPAAASPGRARPCRWRSAATGVPSRPRRKGLRRAARPSRARRRDVAAPVGRSA